MAGKGVVTIARGYGSGGRTMGRMLAEALGWAYYDMELLQLASDDSGISEQLFAQADEKPLRRPLFRNGRDVFDGKVIPPDREDFVSNENLFRYQAKVIRQLAEEGDCVIVGRCANYVLRDVPGVVRLYVHAPHEVCVTTVMRMYDMTCDAAEKKIRAIDKRRADYYRYYTGHDWRNADDYDLCIDSARLGWEKSIRIIRAYLDCL